MEVYVDDMLVKSKMAQDHVADLSETFSVLRRYRMKLNPANCAFGVTSGKFLGFVITQRGIEANPEKIRALQEITPPRTVKEVQRLTGRVAALGRFVARSAERCLPFFAALKKPKNFLWSAECQQAFEELKRLLASPPLLTKPQQGELLYLYLAVSPMAVSSVLVREESKLQKPILQRSDRAGRVTKWAIELGEFDLEYRPRPAIKAQALADFIVECTVPDEPEPELAPAEQTPNSTWTLHVDGSSNSGGSGAGLILASPDGVVAEQAMRFEFSASNNAAEYEALVAGLKEPTMQEYLRKVRDLASTLNSFHIQHIARTENLRADQLSKLASSRMSELPKAVALEYPQKPSTEEPEPTLCIEVEPSWMDELVNYLQDEALPSDEHEARRVKRLAARYILHEGKLYRRSFTSPLLRCLRPTEADYAMREVHEGICGNHLGGRALAHKILRQGYYWPTLQKDTLDFVRRCDRCQRNANGLKARLDQSKGQWVEDLYNVLWAYRTTFRVPTGETPFNLTYGTEAVIPLEIGLPSPRVEHFDAGSSSSQLRNNLDLIEETRKATRVRMAKYQQRTAQYYNARVKVKSFKVGDLVLRRAEASQPTEQGKMAPNWEGPYQIARVQRPGAYKLRSLDGTPIPRSWSSENLRVYYQ
ncbi:uncharacterized protein LOC103706605 [Phoenix dactylifera]|uniref:Uncharacterized protein LOC103706605 n=1 Tax=Phoenix dactylifera TaxID=42345 RepID=A0A8B8ZID6_PHODC|nr:uncharacterized protein LOC103706605 [Phoenix dactylifera]